MNKPCFSPAAVALLAALLGPFAEKANTQVPHAERMPVASHLIDQPAPKAPGMDAAVLRQYASMELPAGLMTNEVHEGGTSITLMSANVWRPEQDSPPIETLQKLKVGQQPKLNSLPPGSSLPKATEK